MKKLFSTLLIFFLSTSLCWGAVLFDGDDDYLYAADTPPLGITGAITVSLWVNFTALVNNDGGLISKSRDVGKYFGTATDKVYELGILDDNIYFQFCDGTNIESCFGDVSGLEDGTWHHIAVTWDGAIAANNIIMYFDGVSTYTSGCEDVVAIQTKNSQLDIGGYTTIWNYAGEINEVALWDTDLTVGEILQLVQPVRRLPLQIQPSNLMGYWPLGKTADGAGVVTVIDESGGDSPLTASGGTLGAADTFSYP